MRVVLSTPPTPLTGKSAAYVGMFRNRAGEVVEVFANGHGDTTFLNHSETGNLVHVSLVDGSLTMFTISRTLVFKPGKNAAGRITALTLNGKTFQRVLPSFEGGS